MEGRITPSGDGQFSWLFANGINGSIADVKVNANGEVVVAGTITGKNISFAAQGQAPSALTTVTSSFGGAASSPFAAKFRADGTCVWADSFGNGGAGSIAVAPDGSVYVGGGMGILGADWDPQGQDSGTNPFVVPLKNSGFSDPFVEKLGPDGVFKWVEHFQRTASSGAFDGGHVDDLSTDSQGNVYVGGDFKGTLNFDGGPGSVVDTAANGGVFVEKILPDGTFNWASFVNGGNGINIRGMMSDGNGNSYTLGTFSGPTDFGPNIGTIDGGNGTYFLRKLDASGTPVWGGVMMVNSVPNLSSGGHQVAVDGAGNILLTGEYTGGGGGLTPPSSQNPDPKQGAGISLPVPPGIESVFVDKVAGSGGLIWTKSFQSNGGHDVTANEIAVGGPNDVFVAGAFTGTADFNPGPNSALFTCSTNDNNYITKLDTTGAYVWTRSFDASTGANGESINGLASGPGEVIYDGGGFTGTNTNFAPLPQANPPFTPSPSSAPGSSVPGNGSNPYLRKLTGTGIAPPGPNAPSVVSVALHDPNPTSAAQVSYDVTFSQGVSGVVAGDFTLSQTSGTLNSFSIANITANANQTVYTVTINTGHGSGTLRLDVTDNPSTIVNGNGQGLSAPFTSGPAYTIIHGPVFNLGGGPTLGNDYATAVLVTPTGAGPVNIVAPSETITDANSTTLVSVSITLTRAQDGAAETLSANTAGTNITWSYNPATFTLQLLGTDTLANYQQVLASVTYQDSSTTPNTVVPRQILISGSDGTDTGPISTSTVKLLLTTDKIGTVRQASDGTLVLSLDSSGDGKFESPPTDALIDFGQAGDQVVIGDWLGTGYDTEGVVRSDGHGGLLWILDTVGDGVFRPGVDLIYDFGSVGDKPVVGDWNGLGKTEIGIERALPSGVLQFTLDTNGTGVYSASDAVFDFGFRGDTIVVGDWNGDGRSKIGVIRPATAFGNSNAAVWSLDSNGDGSFDAGDQVFIYGAINDKFLIGDWSNTGRDDIATARPNGTGSLTWSVDTNGDHVFDAGDQVFTFGASQDGLFIGRWNPTPPTPNLTTAEYTAAVLSPPKTFTTAFGNTFTDPTNIEFQQALLMTPGN